RRRRDDCERRSFLRTSAAAIGIAASTPACAVEPFAQPSPSDSSALSTGNFDCLLDLPPVTPGCARLYLCRHGQTENNRLRLVQGARVDPPINGNGYEQARRLGLAVSRLSPRTIPKLAVHSNLLRSRETAEVLVSTAASQLPTRVDPALKVYGEMASLGEVDFGSLEGIDVKYFRQAMRNTFASWSLGDIDRRTGGGGESGREVLERAALALDGLSQIAASSSSPVLAVSHSTYLRILLSLVNDTPLAESVLWKIQNGSVNVVDVHVDGKKRLVTSSSSFFGGELVDRLRGSNGLKLEIPEVHLVRRNEVRHLEGMNV
ncbi:hypothetical protein ACHAWF_004525, partial [Thalassiosira exigua]